MMNEIDKIEELMQDGNFPIESMARIIDLSTPDLEEILRSKSIDEKVKKRINKIYGYWKEARDNKKDKNWFLDIIPKLGMRD